MKKWGYLLILLMCSMEAQSRSEYIKLMMKAENSSSSTKKLLSKAAEDFSETKLPVYESYMGVANLLMAKHAFNPISKLSYFNKGKKYLEAAVSKAPDNLEVRLMRYTSQKEMPTFLGYSDHIEVDKKFLANNLKNSTDSTLIQQIREAIKN